MKVGLFSKPVPTWVNAIDPSVRLEPSQNQTPPIIVVSTLVLHLCSGKAGCGYTGTGTEAHCLFVFAPFWLFTHDEDRVRVCIRRLEQNKINHKKNQ